MDKKALRAIPRPVTTKKVQDMAALIRKSKEKNYIVTSDLSDGMLIINIFDVCNRKAVPLMRSFFDQDDYITQDLMVEKTVWKTGALENLLEWNWKTNVYIFPATKKDMNVIKKWCKAYCDKRKIHIFGHDIENHIDRYQEDIRQRRLKKKHDIERQFIDGRMNLFSEEPEQDAFREFVEKEAMFYHNFVFYDWKKKWAYCTRCKHELTLSKDKCQVKGMEFIEIQTMKPKHNKPFTCPFCAGEEMRRHVPGKPIQSSLAKSIGMSRSALVEYQWVVVPQTVVDADGENVITIRYVSTIKDYRKDIFKPDISFFERYRTIQKAERSEAYEWEYDIKTKMVCWINEKKRPAFWNPSEYWYPSSGTIPYMPDPQFYKDTWAKYCCIEEFKEMYEKETRKDVSPWFMDQYLNFFRKNPYIEKVIKLGWGKLTEQIVNGIGDYWRRLQVKDMLNTEAKTLPELLGLNRNNFRMLREASKNPSWKDVDVLRYAQQIGETMRPDEYDKVRFFHDNGYEDQWKRLLDYKHCSTIHKLTKYIGKLKYDNSNDYFDYLEWTSKLGYDMNNDFNLFPKDFQKAHDERSKEYQKNKSRIQREAIKEFNKLLKRYRQETLDVEALNMSIDGLFIRMPANLNELTKEGETLHHCVGNYKERVMQGKTTIMFIRKISAPNIPYYTLEWRNGAVVQCRGFKNCDMTPEVKAFVEIFKVKMADYERKMMKVRSAS